MPELPEVETTLRGIKPHVRGQTLTKVIIRHPTLRWPIPKGLDKKLNKQKLIEIRRRGKYLLFEFETGTLILHLGMSGRLAVLSQPLAPKKHDHVDLCFANKKYLRFTDPRRFGALLWTDKAPAQHQLLAHLGPEPLSTAFSANYLSQKAKGKKVPVKSFIMDSKVVVGVGNIYATEALFAASLHPLTPAGLISVEQYQLLTTAIKNVLKAAIKKGGTTLRDFMKSDGKPGYFRIELLAYGRDGKACVRCGKTLQLLRIQQRATVYCSECQQQP